MYKLTSTSRTRTCNHTRSPYDQQVNNCNCEGCYKSPQTPTKEVVEQYRHNNSDKFLEPVGPCRSPFDKMIKGMFN